ncbi:hypothetical protein [Natrinema pallidum]|uniref:Uncharacterized protein n=1 Tax=Natrinema pallidum TaxID=69527 RepID=A0A4P9THG4_9EURY|nr:hypothetical protein [Natrinema pallidum]QCW04197.1 hypothetical protein FGF80_13550 [Natrinema pallidum]
MIRLENSSEQIINSDNISINVQSPSGIQVEIGQAFHQEDGSWKPIREIKPEHYVRLPIHINPEPWVEDLRETIIIETEIDDQHFRDEIQISI